MKKINSAQSFKTIVNCAANLQGLQHYCLDPYMLPCHHFICIDCYNISESKIACFLCGKNNEKMQCEKIGDELLKLKLKLKENINDLYEIILINLRKTLQVNNDKMLQFETTINNHFKFIEILFEIEANKLPKEVEENHDDLDWEIIKRIKANNYKLVNLKVSPLDLCAIDNDKILVASNDWPSLRLYDKTMKCIKKIPVIDTSIVAITCDENFDIYACDSNNDIVVKLDINLNQLGVYSNESKSNKINRPTGICYFNKSVYVCDYLNQRIVKISSDLKFQTSFLLSYYPYFIKNINNLAMIRPECKQSIIYFHDLNGFTMLKKYESHNGLIGASTNYFYEFYPNNQTFYCYDKSGNLLQEIQVNDLATRNKFGSICVIKEKLYLLNYSSGNLIVF